MTFSFSTDCTKQSEFFMQQEGTSLPDGFILLPTPVAPSCEPLQSCSSEWSFVQAGICESSSLPRPFLHYFTHPPESRWIRPTFHWCIMRWENSPLPHKENPFYFCKKCQQKNRIQLQTNTIPFPFWISINANCINSCLCKANRIAQWVKQKQYDVYEASVHLYIWCFTQLMLQVFLVFSFLLSFSLSTQCNSRPVPVHPSWGGWPELHQYLRLNILKDLHRIDIVFSFVTPSEAF